MSAYLNDAVLLYVNELIDWETYYHWRKGAQVDVAAERAALIGVLETAASICAEIEKTARAGWHEAARVARSKRIVRLHLIYRVVREALAGRLAGASTALRMLFRRSG